MRMKKAARSLLALALALSLSLVMAVPAAANDVPSSTMIFQGALTYDSATGSYSGVLPMVDEATANLGDKVGGTTSTPGKGIRPGSVMTLAVVRFGRARQSPATTGGRPFPLTHLIGISTAWS